MGFEGFPLFITWELTFACNLRCHHCASSAGQEKINELTLDESLKICSQFPDLLVQDVAFTGGEPLLRPDWSIIASYLRKQDINTQIITNGLAVTPEIVAKIKEVELDVVGISLDGLEKTHNYIRGHENLFQKVLDAIDLLINADIQITMITTANMLNIEEIYPLFELFQSKGVNRWQIQPIFPLGRIHEAPELKLTEEGYMQLDESIQQWIPKDENINPKVFLPDSYGYFGELDTLELPWKGCNAGISSCGITSDGKIKGCLSLPDEFIEGDLRQQDLWDIWFHPDSFSYNRQFSKEDLGNYCYNCDKWEQCQGGCSAMSYGATERLHNDPYCFYRIRKNMEP